jgi:hypothetical protein
MSEYSRSYVVRKGHAPYLFRGLSGSTTLSHKRHDFRKEVTGISFNSMSEECLTNWD